MGKALQVFSGFVTTPSASYTEVTPCAGDTFAVQNFYQGSEAFLLDAWADLVSAGSVRLRSPNFHDNVNGINQDVPATNPTPVLPAYMRQILQPNDTITVELADTATHTTAGVTLIEYYENLPGADARLFRWPEIRDQIVDFMSCLVTLDVASGNRGNYDGSVAINATQDQFKASTDYALLGYTPSKQYQTIGVTGPDTSSRRVGGPGTTPDIMDCRQWFIKLSEESGLPCIPVLNSQNMSATVVDCIDSQDVGDGTVALFFARLRN